MDALKPLIDIIGYDSGWGCRDYGCEDGPHAVKWDQLLHNLRDKDVSARFLGTLGLKFIGRRKDITSKIDTLPYLNIGIQRLNSRVRDCIHWGHFPVVIGGDHSSAIGTWSAVTTAHVATGHFGLIWIDAHLDAHTLETSHEGKFGGWWHGQPMTALMGYGASDLRNAGGHLPKISPEHVTYIGVHSAEPSEYAFVKRQGIRVITLDEVRKIGFQAALDEAMARATRGTKGFGISLDLDVFHPDDAPGVGACEEDGLRVRDVLPILKGMGHHPDMKALEVVEYNPHKDKNHKTEKLLRQVVEHIFTR